MNSAPPDDHKQSAPLHMAEGAPAAVGHTLPNPGEVQPDVPNQYGTVVSLTLMYSKTGNVTSII